MIALSESVMKNRVKRPPGGEILMKSYPAGNKTSLYRKPCIPDRQLLWITMISHGRSFRIHHEKLPKAPSCGEITMTWYFTCNKSSLPCILDKKLLWITIRKSWSLSDFHKKQQIFIQKTYQFMNVVNGVSHSHKTANLCFSFDSVA